MVLAKIDNYYITGLHHLAVLAKSILILRFSQCKPLLSHFMLPYIHVVYVVLWHEEVFIEYFRLFSFPG